MTNGQTKSIPEVLTELKELTVTYAREQTIDPLKGVGRYLGLGLAGSLLVGIGAVELTVALLRVLQTETGTTFTGNWSWVPYVICIAALCVVAGVAVYAIQRPRQRKETRR
jgi:hypothetical protein